MNESLFIQRHIEPAVEEAHVQGERNAAVEILLNLLQTRLQTTSVRSLKPLLEISNDLEQLKQLAPAAASVESLEMFLEAPNH